jgi:hypothetical protein
MHSYLKPTVRPDFLKRESIYHQVKVTDETSEFSISIPIIIILLIQQFWSFFACFWIVSIIYTSFFSSNHLIDTFWKRIILICWSRNWLWSLYSVLKTDSLLIKLQIKLFGLFILYYLRQKYFRSFTVKHILISYMIFSICSLIDIPLILIILILFLLSLNLVCFFNFISYNEWQSRIRSILIGTNTILKH